jgi:hypothetical protein
MAQNDKKRQDRQYEVELEAAPNDKKRQDRKYEVELEAAPRERKPQNRKYVVELEEPGNAGRNLLYALGALGGLALAAFLTGRTGGRPAPRRTEGEEQQEGTTSYPARLRRDQADQDTLAVLEDTVLDAFLDDEVLSARGIDVGAVSHGIVELSGSVWTRDEARHAVAVAQAVPGVGTVINRMEIEDERERLHPRADYGDDFDEDDEMSTEWTGNRSGMGSRRQGRETDPARSDDSHSHREFAIEKADRDQMDDEGYGGWPRVSERPEVQEANRTNFSEDELDNQSPFGKHAVPVVEQPQAMNSQSRVGEGMKPGTELRLEQSDVPMKPHQRQPGDEDRGT